MPNLPKPRLRRGRRGELVSPVESAEPQAPRVEQIEWGGFRWVNIEHAGALERAWLEEHFDFHALDLEDVLSPTNPRKIAIYNDFLSRALTLPVFDRAA